MYLILSFNKKYRQQNYLGLFPFKNSTILREGLLIFHCELSKIHKKKFQFVQVQMSINSNFKVNVFQIAIVKKGNINFISFE